MNNAAPVPRESARWNLLKERSITAAWRRALGEAALLAGPRRGEGHLREPPSPAQPRDGHSATSLNVNASVTIAAQHGAHQSTQRYRPCRMASRLRGDSPCNPKGG